MPGAPFGPQLRITSTVDASTGRSGGIDLRAHLLVIFENVSLAAMLQKLRRRGGLLDDRAIRREIAVKHRGAALGMQRLGGGADHFAAETFGLLHVFARPFCPSP